MGQKECAGHGGGSAPKSAGVVVVNSGTCWRLRVALAHSSSPASPPQSHGPRLHVRDDASAERSYLTSVHEAAVGQPATVGMTAAEAARSPCFRSSIRSAGSSI